MQRHVFGVEALFCGYGSGQYRAGGGGENPARIAVVGVDDRPVTAAEQLRFRIAVGVHGFVEIQMILRQVGKGGHIKANTADALQGDGVAGNLHHHMGAARIPHPGKQSLQVETFRGGALGGDHFLPDHVRHGTDEAHLSPLCFFQHLLEKQRGGCLAVGAGDTDHRHGRGGVSVKIAAQQRQRQPVGFHQDVGDLPLRLFRGNHCRRAFFQCHGDETVTVGGKAANGHKQAARFRFTGIVTNRRNIRFKIGGMRQNRNIFQQFSQFHRVTSRAR